MKLSTLLASTWGTNSGGFSVVGSVSDETRHVTLMKNASGEIIIAFDCTLGKPMSMDGQFILSKDWWQNLKLWEDSLSVGTVSYRAVAGFVEEYLSLRSTIMNWVQTHKPKIIYVTGFSQGGAHATLYWRDLVHTFPGTQVHGFAFGSPRVYKAKSAREFNRTLRQNPECSFIRVSRWGDMVVGLPPWWMGYRHVGKLQHFGEFRLFPDPAVHGGQPYLTELKKME